MKWIPLLALLVLAACSEGSDTEPTAPPGTILFTEFEADWSPVWSPTEAEALALRAALGEAALFTLLPGSAPTQATEELAAEIRLTRSQPTGVWGADLVVRRDNETVYVSVQTRLQLEEPICRRHLDMPDPSWAQQPIRGVDGCSLQVDNAVSFIEWTEQGQNFHAEFPPEVAMGDVIDWLEGWERIGGG